MVKPITPQEVMKAYEDSIPEEVLEAFNETIIDNWNGVISKFNENTLIDCIKSKLAKGKDYNKHWPANVEKLYRASGWNISYDKKKHISEGYADSFSPAVYIFSKAG